MMQTFAGGVNIFPQDLAPCHTSKLTMHFLQKQKVTVLDWPGNSHVNPIQNLWSIVKRRASKMDCSKKKMVENATKVWFRDDKIKNLCSNLVESVANCVQDLIQVRGGHILY
ncbi:uncharacterized protein TNCV_410651 [Trichonephila clavipes]|nr:uncharacterized protein TNCV_410651 [Trichonephila clavipes]